MEVFLIHALWEGSDDFGGITDMGTEFAECQESGGGLDSSRKALAVVCPRRPRPVCNRPLGQPGVPPRILRCRGREKCYREGMEI